MRHFQRLGEGLEVAPLVHGLQCTPDLWDQFTLRTQHPGTAHAEVSDILVFFNDLAEPEKVVNDREVVPYPAWERLPQIRPLVFNLMRFVEGVQLGRVIITRLPPGKRITPHIDGGAPATFYERYQIMLQCLPGVLFHAGKETLMAKTGDCFHFDNTQEHSVENNSADDRLALIIDIRRG